MKWRLYACMNRIVKGLKQAQDMYHSLKHTNPDQMR